MTGFNWLALLEELFLILTKMSFWYAQDLQKWPEHIEPVSKYFYLLTLIDLGLLWSKLLLWGKYVLGLMMQHLRWQREQHHLVPPWCGTCLYLRGTTLHHGSVTSAPARQAGITSQQIGKAADTDSTHSQFWKSNCSPKLQEMLASVHLVLIDTRWWGKKKKRNRVLSEQWE